MFLFPDGERVVVVVGGPQSPQWTGQRVLTGLAGWLPYRRSTTASLCNTLFLVPVATGFL